MTQKFAVNFPLNITQLKNYLPFNNLKNLYIEVNPVFRVNIKGNEIVIDGNLNIGLNALPKELDFGSVAINSLIEKTITLQNPGIVPLTVTRAEIDNSIFYLSPSIKFPFLLNPRQKKVIPMRFTSVSDGLYQGLLTFFSNEMEHPPVTLKATVAKELVRLSPPSIDFGKVKMSSVASFTLRIWNQAANPLKILQATISNTRFSSVVTLPLIINSGKSGKMDVRFSATDESVQEGILTLTLDDALKSTLLIPLFGTSRKLFPDNGVAQMQSWEAMNSAKNFVDKLTKDTAEFKKTGCLELIQQFFDVIGKDNPLSAVNLNASKLTSLLEERMQGLMQSLTPLPAINTSYKQLSLNPFNFSVYQGQYVWQALTSQFKYISGDKAMRILFPETGSTENNSEFRILEYEEQTFTESIAPLRKFYQPTRVLLSLHKNQTEVALLDLSFQYNANGSASKASGELLIRPFGLSFSYDNMPTNASLLNAIMHMASKPIASLALQAIYPDSTKVLSKLKTIEGSLKVTGTEGNGVYDYAMGQVNGSDMNKIFKLVFLGDSNRKIGDRQSITEWSEERGRNVETEYLLYGDNSKENIEVIIKPWADVLNTFGK